MELLESTLQTLEQKIANLEMKYAYVDIVQQKIRDVELKVQQGSIADSIPAAPIPPILTGMPPPPPPMPSAPLFKDIDPLAIAKMRKSAQTTDKLATAVKALESKEKTEYGMSDVLQELSQVQRKVIEMINTPRSKYLKDKKPKSSALRRQSIRAADLVSESESDEADNDDRLNKKSKYVFIV